MGRVRMVVGGSVRNDDMRKTPIGRCEVIMQDDQYTPRALRARKSSRGIWVCSFMGVDAANDCWRDRTIELLKEAHGDTYHDDDHLGKTATDDRLGWTRSLPAGPAGIAHIRLLMSEEKRKFGGEVGFSAINIRYTRLHAAKPTLLSLGLHEGEPERSIRMSGGWKGKNESVMPDTYLRDEQLLALKSQERSLSKLREGADTQAVTYVIPLHLYDAHVSEVYEVDEQVVEADIEDVGVEQRVGETWIPEGVDIGSDDASEKVGAAATCGDEGLDAEDAQNVLTAERLIPNVATLVYHKGVRLGNSD